MRALEDYLALVPPEHAGKPKFMAELSLALQCFADVQTFLAGLPAAFDLDSAIGVQLDKVGSWIGLTRFVPIPIPNAYFSFDTPGLGFDQGYWFGTFDGPANYLSRLDDDTYRRLLYAKRLCNEGDGTVTMAQGVLETYFDPVDYPGTYPFVIDGNTLSLRNPYFSFDDALRGFDVGIWYVSGPVDAYLTVDMLIIVGLAGNWPTVVDLEILHQMILPFKNSGARIQWAVTTVDGAPVFGIGLENEYIAGLGVGAWGADPDYVAQNLIIG